MNPFIEVTLFTPIGVPVGRQFLPFDVNNCRFYIAEICVNVGFLLIRNATTNGDLHAL